MQDLQPLIKNLMGFAQKQFGFERPPKLFLKQDAENAKNMLGKTAFYDPQSESITLFVSSRHPKDILRSLAHELVHHTQNLRGDLSPEKCGEMGMGYAQENDHLREMEREAYERGNLCFRDWEDGYKIQLQQEQKVKSLKESKTMTVKISKDELKDLILKVLKEQRSITTEQDDSRVTLAKALTDPMAYLDYFGYHQDGRRINIYDDAELAEKDPVTGVAKGAYARYDKEGNPVTGYIKSTQFDAEDLRKARIERGKMQRDSDIKAVGAFTKGLAAGEKAAATRKELERAAADQWGQYYTIDVLKAKGDLQKRALPGAGLKDLLQLQSRVGAAKTGEYDEQTMDKIAKLQRLVGVKDDGIYGRSTARAFRGYIARRKSEKQKKAIARRKREREQMIKSPIAKAMEEPPVLANQPTIPESVELNESIEIDEMGCGGKGKRDEEVVLDEMGMCPACGQSPCVCPMEEGMGCPHCDGAAPRSECTCGTMEEGKMGVTRTGKQCKCGTPGCSCPSMEEATTEKYDDDPALKGDQDKLPDELQKGIIDKKEGKQTDESKIYTPEKEKALYESRYNIRNEAIFDTLKRLWTK